MNQALIVIKGARERRHSAMESDAARLLGSVYLKTMKRLVPPYRLPLF